MPIEEARNLSNGLPSFDFTAAVATVCNNTSVLGEFILIRNF
jgi:hypothetical protein